VIGSAAERGVIGSVVLDPRTFRFVEEVVRAEDFSTLQFELIFAGISRMVAAGEPVDTITVGGHLDEWRVQGFDEVDLHSLLSELPHSAGATRYAEMVRADSVRRQIREAAERAMQAASSTVTPPAEILAQTINAFREVQQHAPGQELTALTLADVLALTEQYDWVIPGLLERKDRFILTGGEGAGKSTFVRQVAIAAAGGVHPVTLEKIDPVRVLIVDAENSLQQWRRASERIVRAVRPLGSKDPAQAVNLVCAPRLDLTRDAHLGQVHRLLDKYQPDVLFIGPLYRLTPRAITNDDDAAPLLAALDTVRDRSIALVMEAHAGHALGAGGERDLRPRGSAALMGWPEFGKGIRVNRDSGGDFFDLVSWRGDRESRAWPQRLRHGVEGELPWVGVPIHR